MSRIAKILKRVRYSLADPEGDRWSDDRLLALIDEVQVDIAVKNNLLRTKVDKFIVSNVNEYKLPDDAVNITRIVDVEGTRIRIRSHAQMDEIDPLWEVTKGNTIEYIVFDKQNPGQFKVYPIPVKDSGEEPFLVDTNGVTADITGDTLTTPFGIVVDIITSSSLTTTFNSIYGIVTDMSSRVNSLIVYYNKRPVDIDTAASFLEINEIYDKAIKHYVVGMAWRDDKDTQNRQMGIEELVFYKGEFIEAGKNSSADNQVSSNQKTQYNDGFMI